MRHLLLPLILIVGTTGTAEELDPGARLFGLHCAVCHGQTAQGNGSMAGALKIETPDLTMLKANNNGVFPLSRTVAQIDSREAVTAHGGTMPVYGWFFQGNSAILTDPDAASIKTTKPIAQIVSWLQSVQK